MGDGANLVGKNMRLSFGRRVFSAQGVGAIRDDEDILQGFGAHSDQERALSSKSSGVQLREDLLRR